MKKVFQIMSFLLLTSNIAFGWEINTHRAIDRCAIVNDIDCGRGDVAKNLHWFAENNIPKENGNFESYVDEELEGYQVDGQNTTYFDYILHGEEDGVSKWNQTFSKYDYVNLIEAGTILEDAIYPNGLFGGDGRFNNHFYDPQNGGRGLTFGYGDRVDAITWAETTEPMGYIQSFTNQYSYERALEYYRRGFGWDEDQSKAICQQEQKTNRARMFVSLGYLLHLLNDMNVPAHTRDDSHPNPDPLEKWMRGGKKGEDLGGFKIFGTTLENPDPTILTYVQNVSALKYNSTVEFRTFYQEQANFTGTNFYSEDSISVNGGTFGGYADYAPNGTDVNVYTGDDIGFITSNLLSSHNRLAMMQRIKIPFTNINTSLYWHTMKINGDNSVLVDNGVNLIPKAVANAEGFVNYFFRGRLKASLDNDNNLVIKNISDINLVADYNIVTFQGGKFDIYYEDENNQTKFLTDCELGNSFAPEQNITCYISSDLENIESELGEEQKLTIIYDGFIGNEEGIAVTKFNGCSSPDNWEITGDNGLPVIYRAYRITVKNKETNEIIEEVYPFNKQGSVYQLETDEWVMASCGGKRIIDWNEGWEGRKWYEDYKLEGTDEIIKLQRFVRDDNRELVNDYYMSVQWQDSSETWLDNHYAAVRYCNGLELGGHSDWFLPPLSNMKTIADYDNHPTVNSEFEHIAGVGYWVSDILYIHPYDQGMIFNFGTGLYSYTYRNYHMNIRCMRYGVNWI